LTNKMMGFKIILMEENGSEPLGTRTPDTLIKSQVLYTKYPA